MKRISALVLFVLIMEGAVYASPVTGSRHDMSRFIANATSTTACVYCHSPHSNDAAAPLWNHALSSATYAIYQSPTIQGKTGQPGELSKACLSCHDGTVAINAVMTAPADGSLGDVPAAGRGSLFMNAADDKNAYIGTDLSNDHPVSISYRPDLDKYLRKNAGAEVSNGFIILPLYGASAPYTVECSSCHNVHDPANAPFLRVANTNSQLCLTCHLK